MRIGGAWLAHPGTQALCAALGAAGYRALFVGGSVRNAILGAPVEDVDLATDALPEEVSRISAAAGFRVIPTGLTHGTVTVLAEGKPHEVTTFRADTFTDGRHAVVAFTDAIEVDAARRDFTMNALYADAAGLVLDPLGGLGDVMARRVRFVGDPAARIAEDYLRILRFFRFHAAHGDPVGGLDAEALAACAGGLEGLARVSKERIGAEMRKLLSAADPAPAMAAMAQCGVLARLLPGAEVRALAPLVHLEAGMAPRWLRRLAVMGGADAGASLRLSRGEAAALRVIGAEAAGTLGPAALGHMLGAVLAADVILCRAALIGPPPPPGWAEAVARGAATPFPVSAADFAPALEGAALGQHLRQIRARWLASDLLLSRAELLA